MKRTYAIGIIVTLVLSGFGLPLPGSQAHVGSTANRCEEPGPDFYSYYCSVIPLDFTDIAHLGTPLEVPSGNFSAAIELPSEFPFYDVDYDTVEVCVHGIISFDPQHAGEQCDPRDASNAFPGAPWGPAVAPFWGDFRLHASGDAGGNATGSIQYLDTTLDNGVDAFVMQWTNISHSPPTAPPSTSTRVVTDWTDDSGRDYRSTVWTDTAITHLSTESHHRETFQVKLYRDGCVEAHYRDATPMSYVVREEIDIRNETVRLRDGWRDFGVDDIRRTKTLYSEHSAGIQNATNLVAPAPPISGSVLASDPADLTGQAVRYEREGMLCSNAQPVAHFDGPGGQPVLTLTPISFVDQSWDLDGNVTNWYWTFGDGLNSSARHPSHAYDQDGHYSICLKVWDDLGAPSTAFGAAEFCRTVTVLNRAPQAALFGVAPGGEVFTQVDITFTDHSTDLDGEIAQWNWDFGNGATNSEQGPSYAYGDNGTYEACLTVVDDDSASSETVCQEIVVLNRAPEADFSYQPGSPVRTNRELRFSDASLDADGSIVSWLWTFGDGAVSTDQDPQHTYTDDGEYEACLTVVDNDGTASTPSCQEILVTNRAPQAVFEFLPRSPVLQQDPVNFTDESRDDDGTIVSWSWDFGDGRNSTAQSPSVLYTPGSYRICLVVTDDDGEESDPHCRSLRVLRSNPPGADFSFTPTNSTTTGVPVEFTDLSVDPDGNISSRLWDFGDGFVSAREHPTHTYLDDGTYTICLDVTDNDGRPASTACKDIEVLNDAPVASFAMQPNTAAQTLTPIVFTEYATDSDGFVVSWSWTLGDGATANTQRVVHRYAHAGTYTVCLEVSDEEGALSTPYCQDVEVLNQAPAAQFDFAPDGPVDTNTPIAFFDNATDDDGDVVAWNWTFGDGTSSSSRNPNYAWKDDGIYSICFTVQDNLGEFSETVCEQIWVLNVAPKPDFAAIPATTFTNRQVSFVDISRDTDGSVVSWQWDFGDDGRSTARFPVHSFRDDGIYRVCLTTTDDDRAFASTCQDVEILNTPPDASFAISPQGEVLTHVPVTFIDNSIDSDGAIIARHWTFGDGGASTVATPVHSYHDDGFYDVCLTVTDDDGDDDTMCVVQVIGNRAPTAAFTTVPERPTTLDVVSFTDASTDDDGFVAGWSWALGDGNSSDQHPMHQYERGGQYLACLSAIDDDDDSATTCQVIEVIPVIASARAVGASSSFLGRGEAVADTGVVRSEGRSTEQVGVADEAVAAARIAGSESTVEAMLGSVDAESQVARVEVDLGPAGTLVFNTVSAYASAACASVNGSAGGASGAASYGEIRLGGVVIHPGGEVPPNTELQLPGRISLVLNEQIKGDREIVVTAAALDGPAGFGHIEVARAQASIENCPEVIQ